MGNIISNTPYDDVYRTMLVEDDELVLPLLNEVFGEHYSGSEKIVRYSNEHFDLQQGGTEEKCITDGFLEVIGRERKQYHLECESSPDGSMIIRMFRYGSQLALAESEYDGSKLRVSFPRAAVVFLRSNSNTTDRLKIEIVTPGGSVTYDVETLKISKYTIEEIFERKLYFLIPFYIFNLEKELKEYDSDPVRREELKRLYISIDKRLEDLSQSGKLSAYSRHLIKDLSNKVVQNLAVKYEQVRKEIGDIMGGQVLDLEIIRVRKEALKDYDELKKQLDEAEDRLDVAEDRLDKAEERADRAEAELARYKALYG